MSNPIRIPATATVLAAALLSTSCDEGSTAAFGQLILAFAAHGAPELTSGGHDVTLEEAYLSVHATHIDTEEGIGGTGGGHHHGEEVLGDEPVECHRGTAGLSLEGGELVLDLLAASQVEVATDAEARNGEYTHVVIDVGPADAPGEPYDGHTLWLAGSVDVDGTVLTFEIAWDEDVPEFDDFCMEKHVRGGEATILLGMSVDGLLEDVDLSALDAVGDHVIIDETHNDDALHDIEHNLEDALHVHP